MADNVDKFVYPSNDDTVLIRPTVFRAHPTTGDDEAVTLTGRTDGIAFLSVSADVDTATPVTAGVSITLTEIGVTGTYAGVMEGANKATAFAATPDNTKLYRHVQFAQDFRRALPVTLKKVRP